MYIYSSQSPDIKKSPSNENVCGSNLAQFLPIIDEIRINPVISHRGYLNFLEKENTTWRKNWVVSYRYAVFNIIICFKVCKS